MMKASEIRELTAEELSAKLGELKKDLFNLRLQLATNQLDNTNKINEVKHDIARINTVIREKQIAEKMTVPYDLAPAHVNRQRAASVAALGAVYFAEGKTETAMEHKPDYLRKSQAEREREEREEKEKNAWYFAKIIKIIYREINK